MKLKYIVTCDENGVKTEPELHYWDKEEKVWQSISIYEVKIEEYSDYINIE